MKKYAIAPMNAVFAHTDVIGKIIPGKRYEAFFTKDYGDSDGFYIRTESGHKTYCLAERCAFLSGGNWNIVDPSFPQIVDDWIQQIITKKRGTKRGSDSEEFDVLKQRFDIRS